MAFKPERVAGGVETAAEYSLFDPQDKVWLTVASDGAIRLTSAVPVRLAEYWINDNAAGSRQHAAKLLDWLRASAQTGEIVDDRYVDCTPEQAQRVGLYEFIAKRPIMGLTGLEIDTELRGRGVIFEMRGPIKQIDLWIARYLVQYPADAYATKIHEQYCRDDIKCIRIIRDKLFD